jgi:hypothetical protein
MISVRNRRQPSSGNKWFLFLVIALIVAACSPKVRPVYVQPKAQTQKPVVKNEPVKIIKPAAPKVSNISLLLPFDLDHLAPGSAYTSETLREAEIATNYYRGFKLALDSLTGKGYNFKVFVYDTKDQNSQAHGLATNPAIKNSDLIVGPVFPDGLKVFAGTYTNGKQPIVSPLSAAPPASYKNPNLITIMTPLEYHAWGVAKYITEQVKPQKVFVLRSGYSQENDYIIPFKKAIDSLSKKQIKIVYLTVIHGQLGPLIPEMSTTGKNVFVIPATDQHFLSVTLRGLDSLNSSYPVTVFGHPNWVKFSFLKPELLQRLNTYITSSDHIDYKAQATLDFMSNYRVAYHTEPNDFAVKGFDEGLYFGELLGTDSLKNITQVDFTGMHNNFHVIKKPNVGYINTHVFLFKYVNFELKKVE